ncbi:hypothetical protein ATANTOWER_013508 [Ataeniobius toweri]|uniref:Uncharacterized protein n=1 Tax=Ataeniobius toweri TaxID=208326 RepID=A0ABU7AQD5_9TELE|nr:hypothetical protein [Ataeniobius toweri]
MKNKTNIERAVYDILDWIEEEESARIRVFWKCVFKEFILNQYPTLKLLHQRLKEEELHSEPPLPEGMERTENGKRRGSCLSPNEKTETKSVKKRKKDKSTTTPSNSNEEQPGPSSQATQEKKEIKEEQDEQLEPSLDYWSRGKSIRTETCWTTPVKFVHKALGRRDASWRKDIEYDGKRLCVLIEEEQTLGVRDLFFKNHQGVPPQRRVESWNHQTMTNFSKDM